MARRACGKQHKRTPYPVERAAPVVRKSQRQYDAEADAEADAKEAVSAPVQADEPTVRTKEG